MLLVTQGKGRVNQLGYNKKTHEYVYFHKGVEVWREKGDESLLNYFVDIRNGERVADFSDALDFPIFNKYCDSCDALGW